MNLHKRLLGKVQGPGASLGALECWPTNVVGEADNPCLFQLAAVGHHDDDDDDDYDDCDNDDNVDDDDLKNMTKTKAKTKTNISNIMKLQITNYKTK